MDLLKYLKGILNVKDEDPFLKNLQDTNRSVNFYENDYESANGIPVEEQYAKWRKGILNLYEADPETFNAIPSQFEYRNMSDYEILRPKKSGAEIAGLTSRITDKYDPEMPQLHGPQMQYRVSAMSPELQRHEGFHASNPYNENYWEDWNPYTSYRQPLRGGIRDLATDIYKQGKDYIDDYKIKYNKRYSTYGMNQDKIDVLKILVNMDNAAGILGYGSDSLEELAAQMYASGWPNREKPSWMSQKQFNIINNMIRSRMNIWPDEVQ